MILTEVSDKGLYVEQTVCQDGKPFAIKNPISLTIGEEIYDDISLVTPDEIKSIAKRVASEQLGLYVSVSTEEGDNYTFIPDDRTIIHTDKKGNKRDLGCGVFSFRASISKKQVVVHKITIEPYKTSDYEIIPHHFDEAANAAEIQRFMDKYIFKPYVLGKNIIGVELNFNKEFYVPEKMESVDSILDELDSLEKEIKKVEL